MCLLVVNHSRDGMTQQYFKTAWQANPDGFGVAYRNHNGELYIYKNMENWETAYTDYRRLRVVYDGAFLLHFRQATHGLVDRRNCHPFRVSPDLVFAHNGIVEIETDDPTVSDTWALCELLKGLPVSFLKNASLVTLLGLAIGNSKLAFLDTDGHVTIINEELGHWKKQDWFSNTSYQTQNHWRYVKTYGHATPERFDCEDLPETVFDRCCICNRLTEDMYDEEEGPICRECRSLEGMVWLRERASE